MPNASTLITAIAPALNYARASGWGGLAEAQRLERWRSMLVPLTVPDQP